MQRYNICASMQNLPMEPLNNVLRSSYVPEGPVMGPPGTTANPVPPIVIFLNKWVNNMLLGIFK